MVRILAARLNHVKDIKSQNIGMSLYGLKGMVDDSEPVCEILRHRYMLILTMF